MLRWTAPVAIAFILVACTPSTTTTTGRSSTTTTAPATTSSTTTLDAADVAVCLQGDLPFVTDGLAAAVGDERGDATRVSSVRWDGEVGCERVTIAFVNDNGAPAATLGPTAVSLLATTGIVRIALPGEISATAVADTLIEGSLVERVYVVRGVSEGLTIDVHGADATALEVRAFTTTSPATLVVDLKHADGSVVPVGAAISPTAVVTTPVPGPNLYPLRVNGYVAPGLRAVHLQFGEDGDEPLDLAIGLDAYTDAWQAIGVDLVDGPSGHATLFVGTADANGRPIEGATVSLDMP